jgi:hypothetical protein
MQGRWGRRSSRRRGALRQRRRERQRRRGSGWAARPHGQRRRARQALQGRHARGHGQRRGPERGWAAWSLGGAAGPAGLQAPCTAVAQQRSGRRACWGCCGWRGAGGACAPWPARRRPRLPPDSAHPCRRASCRRHAGVPSPEAHTPHGPRRAAAGAARHALRPARRRPAAAQLAAGGGRHRARGVPGHRGAHVQGAAGQHRRHAAGGGGAAGGRCTCTCTCTCLLPSAVALLVAVRPTRPSAGC